MLGVIVSPMVNSPNVSLKRPRTSPSLFERSPAPSTSRSRLSPDEGSSFASPATSSVYLSDTENMDDAEGNREFKYSYLEGSVACTAEGNNSKGRRALGELDVSKMDEYKTQDNRPRSVFLVDDNLGELTSFALAKSLSASSSKKFLSPPAAKPEKPPIKSESPMDFLRMIGSKVPRRSLGADIRTSWREPTATPFVSPVQPGIGQITREPMSPSPRMKSASGVFSPLLKRIVSGGLNLTKSPHKEESTRVEREDLHTSDNGARKRRKTMA